ncbi:MAG: hypothetical protein WCJ30_18135 [Deltaproteobacteria bacterium]
MIRSQRPNGSTTVGTAFALALAIVSAPRRGLTQSTEGASSARPSPDDLRSAAEAYDQATRRYIRRDFAAAANWFEAADRLAPSVLALMGAIRAHRQIDGVEHAVRASTLALRLQVGYPNDPRARTLATRTLSDLAPHVGRVHVQCGRCELEVDGVIQRTDEFFIAPGVHRMRFRWSDTAVRERDIEVASGTDTTETAERPATPVPTAPPPPQSFRFHPAVPIAGAFVGVALGVGAGVSWSDALSRANSLMIAAANGTATQQAESAVYAAEDRTTGLLVGAVVVGAFTVGAAVFTRWRPPVVVPVHTADADMVMVTGQF